MLGPYELREQLGAGGMGAVYRAWRPDLDREFALKVILPELAADPELHARFLLEGRAAAALAGHPGIVGVHDIGQGDGTLFLAMDLVEGEPLDRIIAGGDLAVADAVRIVAHAARAVQHAHDHGILHRDIKPANILVPRADGPRGGGTPQVADFGLARRREASAEVTQLTRTGVVLGTPEYMPPEQARGEAIDVRADVWALGATLYDALTGLPPYEGSMLEVISQLLRDDPVPLRRRNPALSSDLEAVVMRCLRRDPAQRYGSAAALADDLERTLRGEPVTAARVGWSARSKRRVAAAAAGVLLTAGAVWAGTAIQRGRRASDAKLAATQREAAAAEQARASRDAWLALSSRSVQPMSVLLDARAGVPVQEAQLQAALADARRIAAEVQRAHTASTLPEAWTLFAELQVQFARRDTEGSRRTVRRLNELADAPGADPHVLLLRAWLALSDYVFISPIPAWQLTSDGVQFGDLSENPAMSGLRDDTARLLMRTEQAQQWALVEARSDVRTLMAAARAAGAPVSPASLTALTAIESDGLFGDFAVALQALRRQISGEVDAARALWERLRVRRGWTLAHLYAGAAWLGEGQRKRLVGGGGRAELDRALDALDVAAQRLPANRSVCGLAATAHWIRGQVVASTGADPTPDWEQGLAALDGVPEAERDHIAWWQGVSNLHAGLAERELARGIDPRPRIQAARALLPKRLHDQGQAAWLYHCHARLVYVEALWATARGRDAAGPCQEVIESCGRALLNDGAMHAAYELRGLARLEWALRMRDRAPRREQLEAALADFEAAAAGGDAAFAASNKRGITLYELAMDEPTPEAAAARLTEAIRVYGVALQHSGESSRLLGNRGQAYARRAMFEAELGRDPAAGLEAAWADFARAHAVNAGDAMAWRQEADWRRRIAPMVQRRGGDPRALLEQSVTAYERALALAPANFHCWNFMAVALWNLAGYTAAAGGDEIAGLQRAEAAFTRGIARMPDELRLRAGRAELRSFLARRLLGARRPAEAVIAGAIADCDAVLERGPNLHAQRLLRMKLRLGLANLRRLAGGGPDAWTPLYVAVRNDGAALVRQGIDDYRLWANLGLAHAALSEHAAARGAFERALKRKPGDPWVQGQLARLPR
ncbi:MAG: serine/threonine-protein kinase [Planctomycetota bacterium]